MYCIISYHPRCCFLSRQLIRSTQFRMTRTTIIHIGPFTICLRFVHHCLSDRHGQYLSRCTAGSASSSHMLHFMQLFMFDLLYSFCWSPTIIIIVPQRFGLFLLLFVIVIAIAIAIVSEFHLGRAPVFGKEDSRPWTEQGLCEFHKFASIVV